MNTSDHTKRKTRVLIVEDEALVAKAIAKSLVKSGYDVLKTVPTGEEAVESADRERPDVVLLDIKLAGEMDGIEAAGRIYSRLDIPFVFMTAFGDESLLDRGKAMGPFGYLIKPLAEREIHTTIQTALSKHQMEKRLRESEQKYRELADLLPQMVYEIDEKGFFTYANRGAFEASGFSPEDLAAGVNALQLLLPEDRERAAKSIAGVLAGRRNEAEEFTLLRKDEKTAPIVTYSAPITRDGAVAGIRGVAVDVTDLKRAQNELRKANDELEERVRRRTAQLEESNKELRSEITARELAEAGLRESEQRFRAVIESANDCIFVKDRKLAYTHVNPAMEAELGIPAAGILGHSDEDLLARDLAAQLEDIDSRVLKGESIEEEVTRAFRNQPQTYLDTRVPLRDADGKIVGLCGIIRNITDRKRIGSQVVDIPVGPSEFPSQAMATTMAAASLAAETDTMVLLTGESGSGKDFLARYIHEQSKRRNGPFYIINCAAISAEIVESELFGHEAGAFTGALRRKRGMLELAEGGTLLLNEIGELPPDLQAKLLSFLDTRKFTRVGGEKDVTANARLIAATNRDLAKEMTEGRFRNDFFYRLNVFSIHVPPLRARLEDIPILVPRLLAEVAGQLQIKRVPVADQAFLTGLSRQPWPGNVRELRNALERALILSRGGDLGLEHVVCETTPGVEPYPITEELSDERSLDHVLAEIERKYIEDALRRAGGTKQEAARLLGITRFSLARHMKKLGIEG